MKRVSQPEYIAWRFYLIVAVVLLLVIVLIARVVQLTLFDKSFLSAQGDARALRVVTTPAFRGMISDRDGYPLAISTAVYSVWFNPQELSLDKEQIKTLSKLLNIKSSTLQKTIKKDEKSKREFVYLKRNAPPDIVEKIKALKIHGLYLHEEYKRFYPEGEIASHVVGFTNIDDQGQEGIELAYNDWLSGTAGKRVVLKDRKGQIISEKKSVQKQVPGRDVVLSMDHRIQYLAYRSLMEGIKKNEAVSGSVVVLDVKTGEVLAMVNLPSFNPNNRAHTKSEALRNRAVTDVFEPGSTIKAFSVATALASGLYKPDTIIDTYPGWLRVGHNLVRDEHSKGPMTITQILQISSNVGITKMILSLPPNQLWDSLHSLGFGEETGVGFPGERSGSLVKRDKWPPFALATLAFGYGMSSTTLQLAHAYATLANHGNKIPLTLMKIEKPPTGKQVIKPAIANQMLVLLESVLEKGGTGAPARVPGYHVAGKTGTARMVGPHGYEKHRYISSFVGIAPATNPRVVVAVVIHDPQGKQYYGGYVSGPVFKEIMEGTLRILNIPPDDKEEKIAVVPN